MEGAKASMLENKTKQNPGGVGQDYASLLSSIFLNNFRIAPAPMCITVPFASLTSCWIPFHS